MVIAAVGQPRVRIFSGTVDAAKKVELAFRVSGKLVRLPVLEGQQLAKGGLIAQLRQTEFEAQLKALKGRLDQARATLQASRSGERPEEQARLEAQVRAAEARLANAKADFENAERLLPTNAIAVADHDRARALYRVAREEYTAAQQLLKKGAIGRKEDIEGKEATVRSLQGEVLGAEVQLEDATLRAPYHGVIAKRFVEPDQNIKAREPVVLFQSVDELEVVVDVPETFMASDFRTAEVVQLVAEFGGLPGTKFPVAIREVAQAADPVTQTFRVRTFLKTPPKLTVLPGMTATVTFTYRRAGKQGDRILIPISSIFKDSTGEQVAWVIEPDHSVTRRPVKVGGVTGSDIEIVDGLRPGDRIAVAGVSFLRPGMKVRDLGNALGGSQP
jgi:RND family efflux transporter MFP subunit